MRKQILLDMDGVLVDFLSGALLALNKAYDRDISIKQYAKEFGKWDTCDYYGITLEGFWAPINETPNFWMDLEPFPWTQDLYKHLCDMGDVTIVTAPSWDPECAKQKLQWLDLHLGIKSSQVFLGHRKYLMAGNGILVDDYHKNVDAFRANKGQAILLPANWNTPNLSQEVVFASLNKQWGQL